MCSVAIRHGATDVNFTMRTPKRPAEHSTTTQTSSALAWLSDTAAVQTHCEETRSVVARLLASGGGFARVPNFLPKSVAEACNEMLTGLPAAAWELMSRDEQDDEGQAIEHSFQFAEPEDHPETLGLLAKAVAKIYPELVPSFSAATYGRGNFIHPHDDKAHVAVQLGGGEEVLHSRKYAAVLYLAKGWKRQWGGAFVDLEGEAEHVPAFNSLIIFEVPRMHFVAPVLSDARRRLSLFGWWLEAGQLYELDGEESGDEEKERGSRKGSRKRTHAKDEGGRKAGRRR